jgi:hypothetical protein
MVKKGSLRLVLACLFLLAAVSPVDAQKPTAKDKQGLVDFAAGRINPGDQNYGQCIDEGRRILIEESIDRAYFWSNLAAVGIALCLFVVVVHQHRSQQRREIMTAEIVNQYRNALSRAEAQVAEVTKRNHAFMGEWAAAPTPKTPPAPLEIGTTGGQTKPRKAAPESPANVALPGPADGNKPANKDNNKAPVPTTAGAQPAPEETRSGGQIALFSSDVDLVARINTLQQQLNTSQERERQLRRQLNDSEVRVQKERDKNRNLQA